MIFVIVTITTQPSIYAQTAANLITLTHFHAWRKQQLQVTHPGMKKYFCTQNTAITREKNARTRLDHLVTVHADSLPLKYSYTLQNMRAVLFSKQSARDWFPHRSIQLSGINNALIKHRRVKPHNQSINQMLHRRVHQLQCSHNRIAAGGLLTRRIYVHQAFRVRVEQQ